MCSFGTDFLIIEFLNVAAVLAVVFLYRTGRLERFGFKPKAAP